MDLLASKNWGIEIDCTLRETKVNKYPYLSFKINGYVNDVLLTKKSAELILNKYEIGDYIRQELKYSRLIEIKKTDGNIVYKLMIPCLNFNTGDKIHLHSMRGIYRVVSHTNHNIVITCNVWRYEPRTAKRIVPIEDFKCLAG